MLAVTALLMATWSRLPGMMAVQVSSSDVPSESRNVPQCGWTPSMKSLTSSVTSLLASPSAVSSAPGA